MTIEEIRRNAPDGANGFAEIDGKVFYFFKSSHGWRQIKGNLIQFSDPAIDDYIKPL